MRMRYLLLAMLVMLFSSSALFADATDMKEISISRAMGSTTLNANDMERAFGQAVSMPDVSTLSTAEMGEIKGGACYYLMYIAGRYYQISLPNSYCS